MRRFVLFLGGGVVLLWVLRSAADSSPNDYLTKDGKLKETLQVRDVQGGFAGFTGTLWQVETDGSWAVYRVVQQKQTLREKGQLTREQLKTLGRKLADFDLLNLANSGKSTVNPHLVKIAFGKHEVVLTLGAGKPLPNTPPVNQQKLNVEERYARIVAAVRALTKTDKISPKE
jgi:hypothetical protein